MSRSRREQAGRSDHSWIKLELVAKLATAQVAAFRALAPQSSILLIDGNAGDGEGVAVPQADLFVGAIDARPTPRLLSDLADHFGADVCLCERDRKKRQVLMHLFPKATVLGDHADVPKHIAGYNYALWLSDPCGYAHHGIEPMRVVARTILRSDFIVIFNELAMRRVVGAKDCPAWQPHQKYAPMGEPLWWATQLAKRHVAVTRLYKQSPGFHFRALVVTNYLTEGVRRQPKIEIIQREEKNA